MRLCWLLLCLSFAITALGQEVLVLQSTDSYRLDNYSSYAIDSVAHGKDVIPAPTAFKEHPDAEFTRSWSGAYWVKARISNATQQPDFLLTVDLWEEVTVYLYRDQGPPEVLNSGTLIPVKDRPEQLHRLNVIPLRIPPGSEVTLYMRVNSANRLNRNYAALYRFLYKSEIQSASQARKSYITNQSRVVLILGMVIVSLLYFLALWISNRETLSLLMVLYPLALLFHLANIHGLSTLYIFPGLSGYEMHLGLALVHVITLLQAGIIMAFFRYGKSDPELWFLIGVICFYVYTLISSFVQAQPVLFYERKLLDVVAFIVLLLVAVWKKKPGSMFVLVALSFTLIPGNVAEVLSTGFRMNLLPTGLLYQAGVTIQMIIFTLGTARLFSKTRKDNAALEAENARIIQQQNEDLRVQVEIRTRELTDALGALRSKTLELEEANRQLTEKHEEISHQADSIAAAHNEILQLNTSLEKQVQQRTRELELAIHELDTFLYQSSHNLRRPLTTLQGLMNLIIMNSRSDQIDLLVDRSRETITGLDNMLRKLTMIKYCLDPHYMEQSVELMDTMHEALTFTGRRFDRVMVHATLPENESFYIRCNPELARSIFECLFENSIQYNRGDSVELTISYHQIPGFMVFQIQDEGTGIPELYLHRVFEMFYRANETSTGNGLGLYIVHRGMQALGGYVRIQSEFGQGTTVSLHFPISALTPVN